MLPYDKRELSSFKFLTQPSELWLTFPFSNFGKCVISIHLGFANQPMDIWTFVKEPEVTFFLVVILPNMTSTVKLLSLLDKKRKPFQVYDDRLWKEVVVYRKEAVFNYLLFIFSFVLKENWEIFSKSSIRMSGELTLLTTFCLRIEPFPCSRNYFGPRLRVRCKNG